MSSSNVPQEPCPGQITGQKSSFNFWNALHRQIQIHQLKILLLPCSHQLELRYPG
jgi:hypothetical protein